MTAKAILVFYAQTLLAQHISAQCCYNPIGAAPCAAAQFEPAILAASNGGGFRIASYSPIGITGLSMTSENSYEGPLTVCGTVPFLAAVSLEGSLPTSGCGEINYGCGNGEVAMTSEDIAPGPYAGPYGYGPEYCCGYPSYEPAYGYNTGYGYVY